jgi:hypothetical protein
MGDGILAEFGGAVEVVECATEIQRETRKEQAVDAFENMSDEELEAYVNGDRSLEH